MNFEPPIVPVILSGGSGTRLWPLSREHRPKQFQPLVSEQTMLQETYLRTQKLAQDIRQPIIVCNEAHRFLVAEQLRQVGAAPQAIVLEPEGRNTAPAIAIAAWLALHEGGSDRVAHSGSTGGAQRESEPLLLVLPADHVINDLSAFTSAVSAGVDAAAEGHLVTFGIVPSSPETGYGYLLKGPLGAPGAGWHRLERFVEKPDLETAVDYVKSGTYLWNSGMFLFSARRYLDELKQHAPAIAAACASAAQEAVVDKDYVRLGAGFLESPSDSIDYAVMERTAAAAVVPLDAGWSDVGAWPALYEILEKGSGGNVLRGDVIAENCRDCYISSTSRVVAVVGAEGYVVVETPDAVLVMPKDAAQDVKRVVEALKAAARGEI